MITKERSELKKIVAAKADAVHEYFAMKDEKIRKYDF